MPKSVLVTAADAGYFSLLKDWVDSIRACPELADLETCVLDIGLDATQRDWLAGQRVRTIQPDWDVDVQNRPGRPTYYKAMTARPYLPKYFSGYDIIGWLDADIWVQDAAHVHMYFRAAEQHGFALTPEIDRSYGVMFGEYNPPKLMHHATYYQCFGRMMADQLVQFPIMNSGAFAARREHPVWPDWQKACHLAMQNAALKHSEQAALNYAIYNGPPASRPHMLPSRANWICGLRAPMWDPTRRLLVEPAIPYEPIGLVHLTGEQKPVRIASTTGGEIATAITYSGIRALRGTMTARAS
jgi:hypothetical protein